MKNFYQASFGTGKIFFTALLTLVITTSISAQTTLSFTNSTGAAITDDAYNGTLGTMAGSGVTVSGIPVGSVITDIKVIASMNHTWVGDLVLKLETPDLDVLGVMSRPGFGESADNGTGGFGSGGILVSAYPVTFSDTGTYDAEGLGGSATNVCELDGECSFISNAGAVVGPPFTFSDLYSGTMNGTWTFYAGDAGAGDVGNIAEWTLEITYVPAPANDDCADATTIGCSLSTSVSGTTVGATVDASYSNCGAGGNNTTEQGVWYVYPGDNSQVTITTCDASGTGYDTRLTVYSGTCGALSCLTANDDMSPTCATGDFRSSVTFNAFSGTDYYVFVHGYQLGAALSETGDFILNLSCGALCTPVPANDACASAQTLTLGVTASGSTLCSSSSAGLANPDCVSPFVTPLDDWYVVTTGAGSTYNVTLTELTATNTGFNIYTGTCGSLTELTAFCFSAGTFPLSLSPSTTYYIRVYNTTGADEGTFDISVTSFSAVSNDDCSSVTPATLTNGVPVVFTGSTVNASASAEETSVLGFAAVWEAVTLTGGCNNLTFDFCGTAAGVMTQGFFVYSDCPLTGFTAGSDDYTTCGDGNLTVNFYNLPAGTYYLPVISDPIFNTLGTYTMNVVSEDCPGPPVNDDCASALPVPCGTTVTGSTTNATLDGPATDCNGNSVAPDVWYTYTGTGEDFTASLCGGGTDYDSKLDVYTGTCGALISVDCNDDSCDLQSEVAIPSSTLGVTYYIRVHGFSGEVGNYELTILDNPPTISCPATVNVNTDAGICTASGVNLGTPVVGDDCGTAVVTNDAPSAYPLGNTTVTWTATDAGSQTATCTQTVTVTDNEDPVITCPSDVSVSSDAGNCNAVVSIGTASATDNCGVLSVTNDASSSTFSVGVNTVTWTAEDVNGNTSDCSQTITVTDNELPTVTCPADVSVSTDGGVCEATGVTLGTPTTADNCGLFSVTDDGLVSYPEGNTIVTWTVTDVNSNTATCTQTVTVTDNEDPLITCPTDVTVSNDLGSCDATGVTLGTPSTSDNCGVASVTDDSPSSFTVGNTTVTWTVTDINGNAATCTQTVTVTDDELPVITCGSPVTVSNATGVCGIPNSSLTVPGATDNCGVATVTSDAPATLPIGTTTVTWTATDVNGNIATCSEDITVTDDELPTITCPADVSASVDLGSCDATNVSLGTPVTADNCGVATVTNDGLSNYPTGNTTVTWTVTDVNGNSATCSQTVTVVEDEEPVITCPADVTVSTDLGSCDATGVALGTPVVTDNCPGESFSNDAPASFPVGTTTVTWTATDAAGNTATCTQTVTVTDDELPVITCATDVTVSNTTGICGTSSSFLTAPAATDNCGIATVTNDAPATLPVGNTVVTWTVTDVNGNAETCTQTTTVTDDELPVVTCPVDVSVSVDAGSCFATNVVLGAPTSSDNCGVATTTNDGLASYPAGNTTVTWTITDVNSNAATCTQTVTVTEDEDPLITCPSDVTVSADAGSCDASGVVLGSPVVSDNCAGVNTTNDALSSFPVGTTTVTWTATDAAGNTATCTQTVAVTDDELPVITCAAGVTVSNEPGICGTSSSFLTAPTSTDNCGIATVTNDAPATLPVGNTVVTWTVTDVNGNAETCTQNTTVTDDELPVVTCPADVSVSVDLGSCFATNVVLGTPTSSDNCGVATTTNDELASYPAGNTTVTWTVTDVNGNDGTCTQIVTVNEDEDPVIACPSDVTVSADTGNCDATGVTLGTPITSDNCGVNSVTNNAPSSFPVGNTTVTWTVTDDAGNTATCIQTVTVTDDENPNITCAPSVTVDNTTGICGTTGVSLTAPPATDNCSVASVTSDAPATLPLGNTTVTWTATDANGNSASCSQTITVVDVELPSVTCAADVTVSTDLASCSATNVVLGNPITSDNCGVATVGSDDPGTYALGNTTVTWTVTDVNGNISTCTQIVTVTDNEVPNITCPVDVTVSADAGSCDATGVTLGTPVSGDNCSVDSVTNDAPSSFTTGNTTVTWTAIDGSGNTSTCSQTVTVTDDEDPVITCSPSVTVNNSSGDCGATGLSLTPPASSDNCSVASVTNDVSGTLPLGSSTVTWTATDASGNTASCSQTVTVVDAELPAITCPADVTVSTDAGSCSATNVTLGTETTSDNCGIASVSNDAPSSYALGNTTVTWTVTDVNGNSETCTQIVTVTDDELPTITCPVDVSVSADAGSCNATGVVLGIETTADNCGVATSTNNAPSSYPIGNTTVTWTATDVNGNSATCTQTVAVTDSELPTITCPADVSVDADAGSCDASTVALGTPTTADNCLVATVTNDAPTSFSVGNTTVTWTVTDVNGNSATCTQTVTVTDNELPIVACPADVSVDPDAGSCDASTVALGTPTSADNCAVATVTNDAPSSFSAGNTTVTWTVTDASGNSATCAQTVTVTDNELPTITCPVDVSVDTDAGSCTATNVTLGTPIVSDNCVVSTVVHDAPPSFLIGNTTVTWTVTDAGGNTATCAQIVIVTDNENPVITCPATVNATANASPCVANNVVLGTPIASDNCGVGTVTNNGSSTYPVGTTSVIWTVTDVNGNTAACSQSVIVSASVDTSVVLVSKIYTAQATGASFQWYNCTTNSIIAGETNASFAPTATGSYAVIVTQNGCVDTSACFSFVTSIGENILSDVFKVYPNPATDQLMLKVEGSIKGISNIQLFDLEGKVVRSMTSENMSGVYTISLEDLASAVYLLRVNSESGVWNTRVMKID